MTGAPWVANVVARWARASIVRYGMALRPIDLLMTVLVSMAYFSEGQDSIARGVRRRTHAPEE